MKRWLINFLSRIVNRYDAASFTTSRSYRPLTYGDARVDLTKGTREVLQARSRDFERNSPLYTKLCDIWEQYTVGTGIQLYSASSDAEWNIAADRVWERWKPVADIQSRLGFDNLQGIISRSLFVDGEIFVVLTREGQFPRVQLVEAHRCKTPPQLEKFEGVRVIDGVEIDENGRPIGYWFIAAQGDKFARYDADNVVHIFEPSRPSQYRGTPYITAALNVLHDREDLRALEMKAAKDAADLSTVVYSQSGEPPPGLGLLSQKFGGVSVQTESGSYTENKREYYQSAVGGRVVVAQSTDKIEQHVPARPGADTREYWRLLDADVCAAAGIPISLVFPDSMQGTVYRGALDAAAAFFRCKTALLSTYFRRIRNYVIETSARFDRTIARLPDDWRRVSNGTVRAPNVDIGRNSTAIINELAAGIRT
ncbi:MAG: phage portal protein, partial [Anaerolineae bacterium]|nr:phage portal protein [Anaerolineae bacterium]